MWYIDYKSGYPLLMAFGVITARQITPLAVIVVSILFGALLVANRKFSIGYLISHPGITLFLVISSDVLLKYQIKWVRPAKSLPNELDKILRSGISTGTVLLIAAIGEILTERSGIQNLALKV